MPEPATLEGFTIPTELQLCHTGETFLFHDSGVDDEQRVIVFATLPALDLLEQADDWFCDGTFSTAPNVFYQVYTIHGTVEGYHIPLVYALLPDKKEETYQKLFNLLPQGCKRITIDFEVAVRNALTKLSENNQIQFCFFHLGQNL